MVHKVPLSYSQTQRRKKEDWWISGRAYFLLGLEQGVEIHPKDSVKPFGF